ncbi:hypothetical protein TEA_002051 [Camellia sinensis var. sinensis]|uniref:Uncharacterized protein n=1 Tax=Camellia sinensis var. sinensis TaxID=542762 RepID=A0A4S4DYL1_CAMSN|nr:hypothetical protein TEA_002051 [Camellia sinensis var. sinensis]
MSSLPLSLLLALLLSCAADYTPSNGNASSRHGRVSSCESLIRCNQCTFRSLEEKGGLYKASIPLSQATNPEADVLLAYEMNGVGFFMQKDYKMFPPSVNWDNIDWSTRRPQMDFPVQVLA